MARKAQRIHRAEGDRNIARHRASDDLDPRPLAARRCHCRSRLVPHRSRSRANPAHTQQKGNIRMSRHLDQSGQRAKRNRRTAAAAVVLLGLGITGAGVYAALNATAFNTTAQTVTSGTLKLVMANGTGSVGFGQNVNDLAPGDVVNRFVDVTDNGTIDAQNLTLSVADATPTILTTDATKGLHVTVKSCVLPWVAATGTCADLLGPTTVLNNVALSALSPSTLVSGAITKNSAYHYEISLTLPNQNETTANGTLPVGTIQGLSASLTWTFNEAQRAATTDNG